MRIEYIIGVVGIALVCWGHGTGLFSAPAEAMMGDVGRILYCHVPTAWTALVVYLVAFIAAIGTLWSGALRFDALVEAAVEVGVLLTALLLFQGSVWARPTWGVFWTWDPRLTTSAVMLLAFAVVLVLRRLVEQPSQRATTSAVATIVAFVNVPIVYMSVKWWRTLHQPYSSPDTVDATMVTPLRVAAVGMLVLATAMIIGRWRIAMHSLTAETDAPDLPDVPPPLDLSTEGGA